MLGTKKTEGFIADSEKKKSTFYDKENLSF